jgi:hypothetical protein
MKKTLLALLLGATLAWTQPAQAGKLFLNFYPGFDYSFQGDLVEGLQDQSTFYQDTLGYTTTEATTPAGVLGGLEFGVMFDQTFGLSLSPEAVFGFGMGVEAVDGSDYFNEYINPNMIGGTLNILVYLVSGQKANTYVKGGVGFYHGFVDLRMEDSFPSSSWGTFTGETVGGTLEIGEEFDLGGDFILGIAARGRFAVIDKLLCSNVQGDPPPDTYALARIDISGTYPVQFVPESIVDGSSIRYASLDMSGVQLLVNAKLNL